MATLGAGASAGLASFGTAVTGASTAGAATGVAAAAGTGLLAAATLGGAYHLATKNVYQDIYRCKAKGS